MSLPISAVVNVSVSITPTSPPKIGFGTAGIVSSELLTSGFPAAQRVTYFNSTGEISDVYPISAEVYKSAAAYFSQSPAPDRVAIIAQYLQATNATLTGASGVNTNIAVWNAIADGSFDIDLNGALNSVSGMDFTFAADMTAVALIIQTLLRAADGSPGIGIPAFVLATVTFDAINNRFIIVSGDTVGTITFTTPSTAPIPGTDISLLMMTEATQGGFITQGAAPETALAALVAADNFDKNWYGILLTNAERDNQMVEDIAAWAETKVKVFATVSNNPNSQILGDMSHIGYRIQNSGLTRTTVLYSSFGDQYADAASMGKAFTVDFDAPNSVITLKFKPLATISPEILTSGEKGALDANRMNAYITVGGADMYAEGFMAAQLFFDERHGVDWLVGDLEFTTFAYLLSQATKVPLTDAGTTSVVQQVTKVLDLAERNGLIAAGVASNGDFLPNGYSVTYQKVVDLSAADRASRVMPSVTFRALLAGAVHFVEINGVVER